MRPKWISPEATKGLSCRPDQLAAYRRVLGLSQGKMQDQLGYGINSGRMLTDMERGRRPVPPLALLLLRDHLREHLPEALGTMRQTMELIDSMSAPGEPVSPAGEQRSRQIVQEVIDRLDQLETGES